VPFVPQLSVEAATALPRGQERLRDDAAVWAVAASILAHALVLGIASAWRSGSPPALEINVPVELLSPEQYEAETGNADVAISARAPQSSATTEPNVARLEEDNGQDDGMVHPTRMLSAAALADPKSRQAREMLPRFDPTERSVQLCNVEAMEQVRAWKPEFHPELIVSYATAELAITSDTIGADGAAFLSAGKWYAMRFDCVLARDHKSVVSFAFKVGGTIPPDTWEEHNLPATSSDDD
jgi:hypothetical protein